jgi:hypothetical protein
MTCTPAGACPEHLSWRKVAPGLTDGQRLAAVAVPPADNSVTDRAGNPLCSYNDPLVGHRRESADAGGSEPQRHSCSGSDVTVRDDLLVAASWIVYLQALVIQPVVAALSGRLRQGAEPASLPLPRVTPAVD